MARAAFSPDQTSDRPIGGRARSAAHRVRSWAGAARRREIELRRTATNAVARRVAERQTGAIPDIRSMADGEAGTDVQDYWTRHTVNTLQQWTRGASTRQLEWRFEQYPLFREFSGLWGDHRGEVVLDYGCGPGNDLVGLSLYAKPDRLIGVDVSRTALSMAAMRLGLHRVDPTSVELIHAREDEPEVPLEDNSVDYLQSQGVIHHTSEPEAVLGELFRVLKPGGRGTVMVYNRDSIWFHLYVAHRRMIRDGAYSGLPVEDAFARSTDGEDCPIARCYRGEDFVTLCERAGFEAEYLGGYLSLTELAALEGDWAQAITDSRLGIEHREFLRELSFDAGGRPMIGGYHAGIGGTYRLRRPVD